MKKFRLIFSFAIQNNYYIYWHKFLCEYLLSRQRMYSENVELVFDKYKSLNIK